MSNEVGRLLTGTAGWTIPRAEQHAFAEGASHLARYAGTFPVVEINSSFYRSHKAATYQRWRDSVPDAFQFSVKLPKAITHELRLIGTAPLIDLFIEETSNLGDKLGCILVQLPPSLAFNADDARSFFEALRSRHGGPIALEPRHATWFGDEAGAMLSTYRTARVVADPPIVIASAASDDLASDNVASPRGKRRVKDSIATVPPPTRAREASARDPHHASAPVAYFRLHGAPRMYYSAYEVDWLERLAATVCAQLVRNADVWCIFDNTALGAATGNARMLQALASCMHFVTARASSAIRT